MSLKSFHIVFISLATVVSFMFGIWCIRSDAADAGRALTAAGWFSLILGVVLIGYGWWFLQKIKKWERDEETKNNPVRFDPRGGRGD
ncbi:MAG: hypothetical protein OEQ13_05950 [Acidobacteriota bacterium]|nr:hypothetical protein [Acidobacteriota bacterium]